jgi:carbamoyltransferase
MKVLGISDHIISGAAIVENGRVTAAINEERLTRKKMLMGFPRQSIRAVMDLAGITPEDLDCVAVASRWGHFLDDPVEFGGGIFAIDEGLIKSLFFSVGSKLSFLRDKIPFLEPLYYQLRQPVFAQRRAAVRKVLQTEFGITCPIEFVSHHHSHAASAYYASGYDDALVVTLDASGDGHSSHVYDVTGGKWKLLHAVPAFDSLGSYYANVTHISGFTAGKHEGKITGLAAHGKPNYRQILDRFIQYRDGTIVNTANAFRGSALRKMRAAIPNDFDRADLAASIQILSEDICSKYVDYWQKRSGKRNVALAGGVAANVRINQEIFELPGVDSVFVFPAMSDEGLSAGAALLRTAQKCPQLQMRGWKCFEHVYLGHEFSESEIADALQAGGVEYVHSPNPEPEIAEMIRDGYVVARVNGRMEYGPRALGNRSILYRPDDPSVNDWLNERLKRTEFMPFAPATLAEDAHLCYENVKGAMETARFMTITFDTTRLMKDTCRGVVHIDGTARPQLVSETDNPSYYRIISEFKKQTGLLSIVNTSFNIHEEPIVCTPQDAVRAFQEGHLDVLAIGSFLAKSKDADARVDAYRPGEQKASQ